MPQFDFNSSELFLRSLVTNSNRGLVKGEIYVAHRDPDERDCWDIPYSGGAHCFSSRDIRAMFAPATQQEFYDSITKAFASLDSVKTEHAEIVAELQGINQAALTSGDDPSVGQGRPEQSALGRRSPAAQLRNKAHALRRRLGSLAESVKERQAIVESKLKQKMAVAQAQLEVMTKMVARLEAVVTMVNLYLGRDEELVCLRDGKKAPAGTPITVRQSVLFMDEEVSEDRPDGIDAAEIEVFDKWLLSKAAHLNSVMPEPKGIVVLQVRRTDKEYFDDDSFASTIANARLNAENRKSYWLIRNGDRLHRLWADIRVGERLIPRNDELEHFFYDTFTKERIRPGSSEYYRAMESADKVRRHYMRLCLVLQGILDRTQLLTPYVNGQRINLLDPSTWDGQIRFLRDEENTLTDGRPDFRTWLQGVNAQMRHGLRVVGNFPSHFSKDETWRVQPRYASGFKAAKAYTLVEDPDESLRFLFDRDDEVRRSDGWNTSWGKAERRGSYRIFKHDDFLICIDNASVADMRYYLSDRRQRRHYASMIPLLRLAIAIKTQEAKDEQPFRDLLLAQLAKDHPQNPCTPEKLEQLIQWWKFKNREHRALLADDAKAFRMIVAEYGRQASITPDELAVMKTAVKEHVTRLPDLIGAWYSGDRRFVVLRSIEGWPVFAHREIYTVRRKTAVMIERNEWVLPQKADCVRWEPVHVSTKAWDKRPDAPRQSDYLAPIHDTALVSWVKQAFAEEAGDGEEYLATYARFDPADSSMRLRVVSVEMIDLHRAYTRKEKNALRRTYSNPKPTDTLSMPDFTERLVEWSVRGNTPMFGWGGGSGSFTHCSHSDGLTLGWESNSQKASSVVYFQSNGPVLTRLVDLDSALLSRVKDAIEKRTAHNNQSSQYWAWCGHSAKKAEQYFERQWVDAQRTKYLNEDGDPEFWDDHLNTIPKPEFEIEGLADLLNTCVEVCGSPVSIAKLSLADALKKAGVRAARAVTMTPQLKQLIESSWKLPAYKASKDYDD